MKFNHIGLAVQDIETKIMELKGLVRLASNKIYDPLQDVELQLIELGGLLIELVSGKKVKNLLKKGLSYYHICFEADDLEEITKTYQGKGVFLSKPTPAVLFNNRRVLFVYLKGLGLVEFLERK